MKYLVVPVTLIMAVAGCATIPTNNEDVLSEDDLAAFVDVMMGEFQTLPDNKDAQILDRRVRVNSPDLDGLWIYTQLNTSADNKVYRQRVSNIVMSENGRAILQKSYTLKSPENFAGFWDNPAIFNTLSDTDIDRFANEGCVQKWTRASEAGWTGYVDPQTCIINSKRRNIDIRVEAETSISGDVYKTNERGFDMDMNQIWGSEPGTFITLKRN